MSKKLVKSLLASTARELQNSNGNTSSRNRKRTGRRTRSKRSIIPRMSPGILAGYGSALSSSFSQNMVEDGAIVRGLDLLTSSFVPQATDSLHVSFYMNANPVNWLGTRISAIATAFQNYRPRKFIIHYRPQVGSTDNRSVFIGTLWQGNMISSSEAIEPSLLTSPGGTYLPSWQSCSTVVPLGTRLPMRMFPVRDPPSSVVPFSLFLRSSTGGPTSESTDLPGRVFVEYEYEFRNAIGPSSSLASSSSAPLPSIKRITLRYSNLFLGTSSTATSPTWLFWNEAADAPSSSGVNGYVVDTGPSPDAVIPIGSHIASDMLQARATASGEPKVVYVATINGEEMANPIYATGAKLHVYVFSHYNDPISPSSSSIASSSSSRSLGF